jgi:hypothetical protein
VRRLSERGSAAHELAFAADLLNRVTAGLPASRLALHVCRGNWTRDGGATLTGDYTALLPVFDFLKPGAPWATGRLAPVRTLVDRVSVEIAHVTTYRLSGSHPDKNWTPRECLAVLVPRLEPLVQHIDPTEESPKLKPAVQRPRTLLDSTNPKILQMLDTVCSTTTPIIGRVMWLPLPPDHAPADGAGRVYGDASAKVGGGVLGRDDPAVLRGESDVVGFPIMSGKTAIGAGRCSGAASGQLRGSIRGAPWHRWSNCPRWQSRDRIAS